MDLPSIPSHPFQTKGDQELKALLNTLDNVKGDFDGAADVISQLHKHFVSDDELK